MTDRKIDCVLGLILLLATSAAQAQDDGPLELPPMEGSFSQAEEPGHGDTAKAAATAPDEEEAISSDVVKASPAATVDAGTSVEAETEPPLHPLVEAMWVGGGAAIGAVALTGVVVSAAIFVGPHVIGLYAIGLVPVMMAAGPLVGAAVGGLLSPSHSLWRIGGGSLGALSGAFAGGLVGALGGASLYLVVPKPRDESGVLLVTAMFSGLAGTLIGAGGGAFAGSYIGWAFSRALDRE